MRAYFRILVILILSFFMINLATYSQSGYNLYLFGANDNGQLGDGTYINRYVPTKIGNDNDWVKISTGYTHSLAIKNVAFVTLQAATPL